jgi:Tfp pilus assembly protein PilX
MFDDHANDRRATLVAGLILLIVLAVIAVVP